jgi:hypothetical protein
MTLVTRRALATPIPIGCRGDNCGRNRIHAHCSRPRTGSLDLRGASNMQNYSAGTCKSRNGLTTRQDYGTCSPGHHPHSIARLPGQPRLLVRLIPKSIPLLNVLTLPSRPESSRNVRGNTSAVATQIRFISARVLTALPHATRVSEDAADRVYQLTGLLGKKVSHLYGCTPRIARSQSRNENAKSLLAYITWSILMLISYLALFRA